MGLRITLTLKLAHKIAESGLGGFEKFSRRLIFGISDTHAQNSICSFFLSEVSKFFNQRWTTIRFSTKSNSRVQAMLLSQTLHFQKSVRNFNVKFIVIAKQLITRV